MQAGILRWGPALIAPAGGTAQRPIGRDSAPNLLLCNRQTAPSPPREVFIKGITLDGQTFRPSDWAERLAGAMSCFRPEGSAGGLASFIGYSPYCVPRVINGVKCVIVDDALRDAEPMAWDFVMNFARDNKLQVAEGCLLPPPPEV